MNADPQYNTHLLENLLLIKQAESLPFYKKYNFILSHTLNALNCNLGYIFTLNKQLQSLQLAAGCFKNTAINIDPLFSVPLDLDKSFLLKQSIEEFRIIVENNYDLSTLEFETLPLSENLTPNILCAPFSGKNNNVLILLLSGKKTGFQYQDNLFVQLISDSLLNKSDHVFNWEKNKNVSRSYDRYFKNSNIPTVLLSLENNYIVNLNKAARELYEVNNTELSDIENWKALTANEFNYDYSYCFDCNYEKHLTASREERNVKFKYISVKVDDCKYVVVCVLKNETPDNEFDNFLKKALNINTNACLIYSRDTRSVDFVNNSFVEKFNDFYHDSSESNLCSWLFEHVLLEVSKEKIQHSHFITDEIAIYPVYIYDTLGFSFYATMSVRPLCFEQKVCSLINFSAIRLSKNDNGFSIERYTKNGKLFLAKDYSTYENIPVSKHKITSDLQNIQDTFANAFGVTSVITDKENRLLTRPSNFDLFCKDKQLANPQKCNKCSFISTLIKNSKFTKCVRTDILTISIPIRIDTQNTANWLILRKSSKAGKQSQNAFLQSGIENLLKIISASANLISMTQFNKYKLIENKKYTKYLEVSYSSLKENLTYTIASRTKTLGDMVKVLRKEIRKRIRVEKELELHHNQLEEVVLSRTAELQENKNTLEKQNEKLNVLNEELRQNTLKLKETSRRLLKAQEIANIGNWEISFNDDNHLVWSDNIYAMLGYSNKSELMPKELMEKHISPAFSTKLKRSVVNAIAKNAQHNVFFEFKDIAGKNHFAHDIAEIIYDKDNIAIKLFGTTQDITDLYYTQQELIKHKSRYQLIFDKSPIGIFHYDKDGGFTACNEAYLKVMNIKKDEILGLNLLNELQNRNVLKCIDASFNGEHSKYRGKYISVLSGKVLFVQMEFAPLISDSNELLGGIGIVEDITERKKAEEQARHSKNFGILRAEMWEKVASLRNLSEDEMIRNLFELIGARLLPSRIGLWHINEKEEVYNHIEWVKYGNRPSSQRLKYPKELWQLFTNDSYVELTLDQVTELSKPGEVLFGFKSFFLMMMEASNIKKLLLFPYHVNGIFEGFLSFDWTIFDTVKGRENIQIGLDLARLISSTISQIRTLNIIRESEEKYRKLVENSSDGILIESEGIIVFANQQFCDIIKYEKENIINQYFSDFVFSIEKEQGIAPENSDYPSIHETSLISKEKHIIPVELNCSIITYDNKKSTFIYVRDLTQRKLVENERKRLFTAIEQVHEGIIITNPEGIIEYSNPAFTKTTGYVAKELIGKNTRIFKSGNHNKNFYKQLWKVISAGNTWTGRITNKRKNGDLYEEHTVISAVKDYSGKIINYIAVKRDITIEVQMEQQLKRAQKLQAIGTLAGGIAHDFNNILMGMQISAELSKVLYPNKIEFFKNMTVIEDSIKRAKELINQILIFSRQTKEESKAIRVTEAIADTMKLVRPTLPSTIKIKTQIEDCGFINISINEIKQLIMNYFTNANYAMKGNGTIDLQVRLKNTHELLEHIAGIDEKIENWIEIKITDTGEGMSNEIIERVFEPFFTTKSVGKGTGLGLSIVHGIVKKYSGFIKVKSEVGVGSTFITYLPQIKQKSID